MSGPRPPDRTSLRHGLVLAWASVIWLSGPILPLVRARLAGGGFRWLVLAVLGASVLLVVGLPLAREPRARRRRIVALLALGCAVLLAATVLAPPDPRSRLVELVHFVEYGVLAALVFEARRRSSLAPRIVESLLVVLLVGLLDETVQHLLASRYGEVRDVVLNLVAGGLGVSYLLALFPGRGGGAPLASRPEEWRLPLAMAMVFGLGAGLFLDGVHAAHVIRFRDVEFVSQFSEAELEEEREDRRIRWSHLSPREKRALLRPDETFLLRKDLYATEARFHVQARNEAAARGDAVVAAFENALLERWFDPFLDAAEARRADVPEPPPATYRSVVMTHLWPDLSTGRLWVAVALLEFALAGAILLLQAPKARRS